MSLTPITLDAVVADPHWLCIGYQRDRRELHFAYCDDVRLDDVPFLAEPWLDFRTRCAFGLEEVADALPPPELRPAPRFVLHTSFCCSTLMARCLEMPCRVRVLRELTSFNGFARTRQQAGGDPQTWTRLIDCVVTLAMRAFESNGVTINKPSNVMLAAAPDLLASHADAHAITMFSDLPAYLVSCAKKGRGARSRLLAMHDATDAGSRFAARFDLVPATLGLLEIGALVWHLHLDLLRAIPAVRVLDASRFVADPVAGVRAAQHWLGIDVDAEATRERVERELRRNAKQTDVTYDPARREQEAHLVREHLQAPIDAALAWAERRFGAWPEWLPTQKDLVFAQTDPG
jgi:hypothetical protein